MEKDIAQVLISEEVLQQRVKELAAELNEKYAGKNPVFVGVMKGVVLFFADMVKQINTLSQIDFMWISSYAGTNSTGSMVVKRDLSTDIKGRHVVILEDILIPAIPCSSPIIICWKKSLPPWKSALCLISPAAEIPPLP